jgi:hypothetical protein
MRDDREILVIRKRRGRRIREMEMGVGRRGGLDYPEK